MYTFYVRLLTALFIDCFLQALFYRQVSFLVAMLFVYEILRKNPDWPAIIKVGVVLLIESFMTVQRVGIPLFYGMPLIYTARQVRGFMHFSFLFYPVFLAVLLIADKVLGGYGVHEAYSLNASTLILVCGNLIMMMMLSLK